MFKPVFDTDTVSLFVSMATIAALGWLARPEPKSSVDDVVESCFEQFTNGWTYDDMPTLKQYAVVAKTIAHAFEQHHA